MEKLSKDEVIEWAGTKNKQDQLEWFYSNGMDAFMNLSGEVIVPVRQFGSRINRVGELYEIRSSKASSGLLPLPE